MKIRRQDGLCLGKFTRWLLESREKSAEAAHGQQLHSPTWLSMLNFKAFHCLNGSLHGVHTLLKKSSKFMIRSFAMSSTSSYSEMTLHSSIKLYVLSWPTNSKRPSLITICLMIRKNFLPAALPTNSTPSTTSKEPSWSRNSGNTGIRLRHKIWPAHLNSHSRVANRPVKSSNASLKLYLTPKKSNQHLHLLLNLLPLAADLEAVPLASPNLPFMLHHQPHMLLKSRFLCNLMHRSIWTNVQDNAILCK